ncbi:MAG: hypothetical protein Q8T11_13645 [Elusimicrobiota bacterium]|nr:hypothetical protein [Elusimicrobiota bacterium]
MRSASLAAALLLAAAAPARAGLDVYDAGQDPPPGTIWSEDGYHYAYLESDADGDRWIVDGRVRAKGAEGELTGPGALNANGSILLHSTGVLDKAGKLLGVAPAINGKRAGGAHDELHGFMLSPGGSNAAYVARTPKGWSVVSQQGSGPAFKEPPLHLAVTEDQTLYFVEFGGATWLYRNHKPVEKTPFTGASTSRDLRRAAGVYTGSDGLIYVEIDKTTFGPYNAASVPVFSANGAHSAFLAAVDTENGYDALIVNGLPVEMRRCADCSVSVDDRGRAFQDVIMTGVSERAQIHMAFSGGKSLHPGGQPPKVGLAPGGRHFVYPMLAPQGVAVGLNGRIAETGAPMPLIPAPTVFDGEEYHYWSVSGGRLLLVCGSAEGPRAPRTRCAAAARRAGWPPAEL